MHQDFAVWKLASETTKISVSEVQREMPRWETAIRIRAKGTASFGIEDPLCEIQSRNQTAKKLRMRLGSLREVPVTCGVVSSPDIDFGAFPAGTV